MLNIIKEMHKLLMYFNMNRNVMVIKITLVDGLQQLIYCFFLIFYITGMSTNEEQKYTSSHYIGKESSCKQLQVAEEISALSIIVCAVLCEQSVDCFVFSYDQKIFRVFQNPHVIYATTRVNSFTIFLLSLFYCRQKMLLFCIYVFH
jgi:hypothetical protein